MKKYLIAATTLLLIVLSIGTAMPQLAYADTTIPSPTTDNSDPAAATTRPDTIVTPKATNEGVEDAVRVAFADTPEMISVAKCESTFHQFNNAGKPLIGYGVNIGVFQINKGHIATAKTLGLDINTAAGNIAYARHLYEAQGTAPWKGCLPHTTPAKSTKKTTATTNLTLNLKMGMVDAEVITLQKLLNKVGYKIASSGNGSLGHETDTFGAATLAAVKRFQCSQKIICKGSPSTTGYGLVGKRTRITLLKAASKVD